MVRSLAVHIARPLPVAGVSFVPQLVAKFAEQVLPEPLEIVAGPVAGSAVAVYEEPHRPAVVAFSRGGVDWFFLPLWTSYDAPAVEVGRRNSV